MILLGHSGRIHRTLRRGLERLAAGLVAALCALASPGAPGAQPVDTSDAVRHSGRVVRIGLDLTRIVIEETVAWGAAGPGIVRYSVRLTPHTTIVLLERREAAPGGRASRLGWSATTIPVWELREGDFVTVTTGSRAGDRATALQIVRPDGD